MSNVLNLVAFDIETTGFAVDDEVTVLGFAVPLGCRVFAQVPECDGDGAGSIEAVVEDRVDTEVMLSVHESEAAVLDAVNEFVRMRLCDDEVLLVAYNGETWRGGFDLPFLRTRFASHDAAWPFDDVPYADLLPVYRDLFNTSIEESSPSDLVTVYDLLVEDGTGYGTVDPFDDSAEAVTAFEAGRVADVVVHNVADILRTQALGRLAQRYCSKSDFQVKSLTPTIGGGAGTSG